MLRRILFFFHHICLRSPHGRCRCTRERVWMVRRPNYHARTTIEDDPRIYRAVTLRKPDLTVWVISQFSHWEQGHEGEEIAAITGLRPASFLSCTEYNHFHNIKQSYLVTRSLGWVFLPPICLFLKGFILNGSSLLSEAVEYSHSVPGE